MIPVDLVNKALLGWAALCSLFLSVAVSVASDNSSTKFFTFGPREDLVILDVKINTGWRYSVVIGYTIISTVARTVLQEIVAPWLIQTVQNDKPKDAYARRYAQEIAFGEVLYRWFDWFMYMHILMAQVDMMIVELIGNLAAVAYTTRMYMKPKEPEAIELISGAVSRTGDPNGWSYLRGWGSAYDGAAPAGPDARVGGEDPTHTG